MSSEGAPSPYGHGTGASDKTLTIKTIISLPNQEIHPEVLEARRSGRELILSVYDLTGGAEREIRLDAKALPECVVLKP